MTIEGVELRPPDLQNLAGQTDEDTGRAHLSHSSIGTMLECNQRWGYRYDQHLELIAQPLPLSMGKAFHKALELGDPMLGANELDRPTVDQADYDKLVIEKATVFAAALGYLSRWPADEQIQREVEYRVRLRSPWTGAYSRTFDLLGYADGVIDHGSYLELAEDKFQSQITVENVRRLKLDRQVGLEAYGLWRTTGKPVRVVRYRITRKPSIRQRQKETVKEFVARLNEDYVQRADWYFMEEQLFRSDDDLLLLEAELWTWAEQLRAAKAAKLYPRNTSSCFNPYRCPYVDLCCGDEDARSLYRVKDSEPVA